MNYWQTAPLSNVIAVQSGYAFKSADYTESGHFLMRIGNVQDGLISLDNPRYVRLDERTKPFELCNGDILTSLTGNIGRVARISQRHLPAALNQRVAKLRVKDATRLDEEYLFYFLNSLEFREKLSSDGHGAAQQNVSPKAIGVIPIPLPPLEEQRRIVAVLDEAFAAIATATANAEKCLASAGELFETGLAACFRPHAKSVTLGEIAKFVRGPFGGSLKKEIFQSSGFAVYEQQHAIYDQFSKVRYFVDEKKFSEMTRFQVQPGDILMSCSGTIGKVALVPAKVLPGIINQALLKLTPSSVLDGRYLSWYMRSAPFLEQIAARSGGAALQNVASVAILKEISVTLPSIETQEEIANHIEALRAECDALAVIDSRKLVRLSDLKQSLLKRAFSGDLTVAETETIAA